MRYLGHTLPISIWKPQDGSFRGHSVDLSCCRAMVDSGDSRMSRFGQCANRAKVFREGIEGHDGLLGFCGRHDPEAVLAKQVAKRAAEDAAYREQQKRRARGVAICKALGAGYPRVREGGWMEIVLTPDEVEVLIARLQP